MYIPPWLRPGLLFGVTLVTPIIKYFKRQSAIQIYLHNVTFVGPCDFKPVNIINQSIFLPFQINKIAKACQFPLSRFHVHKFDIVWEQKFNVMGDFV